MTMIGDYDELITASCDRFFGYGAVTAPVWFIGKQEGGGKNWDECRRRLDVWHKRGRRDIEDVVGYHRAFGEDCWFADPPKIQSTWRELIRLRLAMANEPISPDSIGHYQVHRLAGWNGENCLLELLPLASGDPNDSKIYEANSNLDWLKKRKALMTEYGRKRALRLRTMIDEHRPQVVILYSLSDEFQPLWRLISGFDFAETELPYTTYAARDRISYLIIPHPGRVSRLHLSAPTFFREVGSFVMARLREASPNPPTGPTLRKRVSSV
jgi:hypothetical protein